ncbi:MULTISPECIES: LysR family transcriptional regulator [Paenibacillus]|uniref:LysR family transcriptional regulator n=1 Tax=Paenibacillus violae TaxID=3077234 RepID=A0ABU3RIT1_9BACL|nr:MULTISPECIES: LysR family transcriptional regulator [Paenibacillus]MDU0204033.1 LysR family transcriptional regulator [Paenibacillus sp. PFR10]MEC0268251.1 LysR family transcriptional regulator [Paenibacillus anseongense]
MELRQLECFKMICEELHFTRAAERLGITQPTLSYQIKLLEDELGVPLFSRIGKKIAVTEAGSILYNHCSTIFSSLTGAREEIFELQHIERGTLSIGALIGEINEYVSSLLVDFHNMHPRIQIKLNGVVDVLEPLIQNELDFAVTILPVEDERFKTVPLYVEDFYFVVKSDHPFADYKSISFEVIKNEPVIMFPSNHRCRKMIDLACSSLGFDLDPKIETTTIRSLLMLVRSGAGVSILSKTLLEMYPHQDLKMIPITNPSLRREIGVIYLKDRYMEKAAREFIDLMLGRPYPL